MCPTMDDIAKETRKVADAEMHAQYLAELRPKIDAMNYPPRSESESSANHPGSTIASPQPTRAAYLSRSTSSPNALSSPKTSPAPAATIPQSPTPKTPSVFRLMSVFS